MDNLLSSEEVRHLLEVNEEALEDFCRRGRLHAYKIGGTYLRYRKDEVLTVKQELHSTKRRSLPRPWLVRMREFWRFNNFYIVSLVLIAVLFYFAVRS